MPISPQLKDALWYAHGKRCAHSSEPLAREVVEVDHILPQSLWDDLKNKPERLRLLTELGLPSDFEKDSLLNLLPCHRRYNRQKSDRVPVPRLHALLDLANQKLQKVQKRLEQSTKASAREDWVSKTTAVAETSPEHRKSLLQALDKSLSFEPVRRWDKRTYEFVSPRIRMTGRTPRLPRSEYDEPSLLIEFNTLFLHRLRLRLSDEQIITDLFESRDTDWRFGQRQFVTTLPDTRNPDVSVTLAGMEITLTPDELDQWCELIDALAPRYLEALLREEEKRGTIPFPLTGKLGGVVLCAVPRPLWYEIQKFAHVHDFEKGRTAWHIFDATGAFYLRVGARGPTWNGYDRELTCVQPVRGTQLQDSVELAWISECGLDRSSEWDASTTHDWLLKKLIPKVTGPKNRILHALGLKRTDIRSRLNFGGDFKELKPEVERLSEWVEAIQEHYMHAHNQGVPLCILESAFDGMEQLVRLTQTEGFRHGYLATKLGADSEETGLLEWVRAARRRDVGTGKFSGSEIEMVFRCAKMLMDDHAPAESPALAGLVKLWRPLNEHYRLDWLRLRHSRRPEEEQPSR